MSSLGLSVLAVTKPPGLEGGMPGEVRCYVNVYCSSETCHKGPAYRPGNPTALRILSGSCSSDSSHSMHLTSRTNSALKISWYIFYPPLNPPSSGHFPTPASPAFPAPPSPTRAPGDMSHRGHGLAGPAPDAPEGEASRAAKQEHGQGVRGS